MDKHKLMHLVQILN